MDLKKKCEKRDGLTKVIGKQTSHDAKEWGPGCISVYQGAKGNLVAILRAPVTRYSRAGVAVKRSEIQWTGYPWRTDAIPPV
jgi:hypothetical protein